MARINFEIPKYIESQINGSQLIRHKCRQNPGHSFLFTKYQERVKANDDVLSYWRCTECKKLKERITITGATASKTVLTQGQQKTIMKDPEFGHHLQCAPQPNAQVEVKKILQVAKSELRRGRKRPLAAYTDACGEISKQFQNVDEHDAIVDAMPKCKKIRRSLHQNAEVGTVPIDNYRNLPVEYQKTYRGRHAEPENPYFNDQWLLFSNNDMLIFCSQLDLQVLHSSSLWIVDGTFKVCPPNFKQVYTILGHGHFGNEAMPLNVIQNDVV